MTITLVGTVFQGTNVTTLSTGYNLIGLQEPISTNLVSDVNGNLLSYGLPVGMTSSNDIAAFQNTPTLQTQDALIYWTGSGYITYFYFNGADATAWENSYGAGPAYPAGFYDAGGIPPVTNPTVNQGFFIHHLGAPIQWTNSFTVQ
jgi:hypothetical protein